MLIRYQNGATFEAVILSLQGGEMRVALKGGDDVVELHFVNNAWLTEDCEPVTFDFSMAVLAAVGIVPPEEVPVPKQAVPRSLDAHAIPLEYLN
jgi:hypothetical protein